MLATARRAGWTAALAVPTTLALVLCGVGVASATPGHPGQPDPARVVFHEDFEAVADTGLRTMLSDYPGFDGQRYSADSYWMDAVKANGMVLSWGNTKAADDATGARNGTEVTAFNTLRQLSEALGKVNGTTTPQSNTAISAYTQDKGNPPAGNKVMFASTEDIQLEDAEGRFLAFSMTAAATNGKNKTHPTRENPQYMFYVSQDGVETPLSAEAVDPIADGRAVAVSDLNEGAKETVYAGEFASDHSFLYDGGQFGIVIRNLTSAHMGNDGAFDDIKVLDVTPQLDKQFGQAEARTGDSVRLTFTVTNTSELANKKGWAFTDALPAGLVVADVPNLVVDGVANVVAQPGADAITVSNGDLEAGDDALTISVDVTSKVAGTYTNGPSNIVVRKGLDSPDSTTVTFKDPAPAPAHLVVTYVDEAGNPLAEPDTSDGKAGDVYDTTAKTIDGWTLVEVQGVPNGLLVEGTTEVVYVYKKNPPAPAPADLTVRFVDEDGNPLADPTHRDGTKGEHYDTTPAVVPGYDLVQIRGNASGSMEPGTEVVYVYRKTSVVPVTPVTPVTPRTPIEPFSQVLAAEDPQTSSPTRLAATGSDLFAAVGGIATALALVGAALVAVRRRGDQKES